LSDAQRNRAVVERFWHSVAARDIDAYLALFTEQAVAHDPVNKPSLTTPEARRASMQAIFDGFARISAETDYVTVCGDHSASKWTVVGTTAEGQDVVITGIDVIRHAADGRIEEMWGYFDN